MHPATFKPEYLVVNEKKEAKHQSTNCYSSSHKTAWKLLWTNAQQNVGQIHRKSTLYLDLLLHTQHFLCNVQYLRAKLDHLHSPSDSNFVSQKCIWTRNHIPGKGYFANKIQYTVQLNFTVHFFHCSFPAEQTRWEKLRYSQTTELNPQPALWLTYYNSNSS